MSRTYKATGINLKGMPLGESDRLLTILTPEYGLIRAVAPGVRKHQSKIGARSGVFVVNELLLLPGKSLDKIIQAETIESYPGLSQDLCKLTASQYLGELALHQALSQHPQEELFYLLREHLGRLERSPQSMTLACLVQGIFHLLALAGLTPQVHDCCITQEPLGPDFRSPDWRVGFSVAAGGIVSLTEFERLAAEHRQQWRPKPRHPVQAKAQAVHTVAEAEVGSYQTVAHPQRLDALDSRLTAIELLILQSLGSLDLTQVGETAHPDSPPQPVHALLSWLAVERVLRDYAQYHFDRPIRSAALIESCFSAQSSLWNVTPAPP
jgi:DNA repair protein RecO (recombination protein O)